MLRHLNLWWKRLKLWQVALFFSVIVGGILFSLAWDHSITADEAVHFTAGYSYVVLGEYKLNPEHPPLLKILSGLSIFLWSKISGNNLMFDTESVFWKDIINGQVPMSHVFLSNNTLYINEITFWARVPSILVFISMLWYIIYSMYGYTKSKLKAGFIVILCSFSINLLAHSSLVTTDLIASFAFILAIDRFIKYITKSNFKNLIWLSLSILIASLSKFSVILLLPVFFIFGVGYIFINRKKELMKSYIGFFWDILIIILINVIGISMVYWFCMRNMSIELDNAMIHTILSSNNNHIIYLKKALLFLSQIPPLRYILQYILGQIMVFIRVSDGNLTYLLGNVTTESFKIYFPLSYLFKESILVILSLGIVFIYNLIFFIKKYILKSNIYQHKKTLYEILVLMVITWYWVITLISNLNLGIRHILPILLLTYIWLGLSIVPLIKKLKLYPILFVGLIYYIFNTIIIYPNYLSYINPIGNLFGPFYNIFVDSNLDWGQDLKRLKLWIDKNNVEEIYIDYFGGDNMYYYFEHNDNRVRPYSVDNVELKDTYLAVSVTQYHLKYKSKLNKDNQEYWILANKNPIKIIGGSILIFKL